MSERLLFALSLLAAPLAAQSPAQDRNRQEEIARLERVRDSVGNLWATARDLVLLQDSLEHQASIGSLDTLTVGVIRIITNRSSVPLREAAERYLPSVDSLYGDALRQLYEHPVTIQAVKKPRKGFSPVARWGAPVPEDASVGEVRALLKTVLVLNQTDQALREWLPGDVLPSILGDSLEARDSYISMVTSDYEIGRRCFAGDMRSCRIALRLDHRSDSLAAQMLVTISERQTMVASMERTFRERRNLEGLAECRAGVDDACIALLRSIPSTLLPHPLPTNTRQLMLHLALRTGGRDAYQRLMRDTTASIGDRMAAAAGIPIDSLVVRWHGRMLAGRPVPASLSPLSLIVGLGWIVLLGYFGLRSSRWRLG